MTLLLLNRLSLPLANARVLAEDAHTLRQVTTTRHEDIIGLLSV